MKKSTKPRRLDCVHKLLIFQKG